MKDDFKEIFIMGLGAMAYTTDKAKEMKEELVKRGTEIYNNGKILNEELKHNIDEKCKQDNCNCQKKESTPDEIIAKIKSMKPDEQKAILEAIKQKESK